jgi:hypothetical protein
MRTFAVLLATLLAAALMAGPALAQTVGTFGTSPSLTTVNPSSSTFGSFPSPSAVNPQVSPSMTGGIPGTFGGTANPAASGITGGIPGTLGSQPFNAGGSTTGAIGTPSTFGTSTTGSNGLLGGSVFGGSTGAAR